MRSTTCTEVGFVVPVLASPHSVGASDILATGSRAASQTCSVVPLCSASSSSFRPAHEFQSNKDVPSLLSAGDVEIKAAFMAAGSRSFATALPVTGGLGSAVAPEIGKVGISFGLARPKREAALDNQMDGGGGGGNKGSGNEDGGWGPGGDDEEGDDDEEDEEEKARRRKGPWDLESLEAVLLERGLKLSKLPKQIQQAFERGHLDTETLTRYLNMEANPLLRGLLTSSNPIGQGIAQRILADPNFMFKLVVEEVLALSLAAQAEMKARGAAFKQEVDYVSADLATVALGTFALVWVYAPATSITYLAGEANPVGKVLGGLPNYVFQTSSPGRTFNILHRLGGLVLRTLEASVATAAVGAAGHHVSDAITKSRKASGRVASSKVTSSPLVKEPQWKRLSEAGALNAGPRYQIVNGIEQAMKSRLRGTLRLPSFALRYGNSRLGEWAWLEGAAQLKKYSKPLKGLDVPAFPERTIVPKYVVTFPQAQKVFKAAEVVGKDVGNRAWAAAKVAGAALKEKAFAQAKDPEPHGEPLYEESYDPRYHKSR